MKFMLAFLAAFFFHTAAWAEDCVPPPGGKCLTAEQLGQVKTALRELQTLHESEAQLHLDEPVIVVHDWEGRVYVNGGESKPLPAKLILGTTIERDLAITLPTQVYYRPKPPDPMFRLRVRAQAGVLVPQLVQSIGGDGKKFWDVWASFDFFHLGPVNAAVNAGVQSASFGPGLDLTKNFGITGGYAFIYDGLKSSVFLGTYFSFN